jgi:hypothetical protein
MTALEWLAAVALMTALFWVPYVLERMVALGVLGAMKPAFWSRRRCTSGHGSFTSPRVPLV